MRKRLIVRGVTISAGQFPTFIANPAREWRSGRAAPILPGSTVAPHRTPEASRTCSRKVSGTFSLILAWMKPAICNDWQHRAARSQQKVPDTFFLFFRSTDKGQRNRELIAFITPRVIRREVGGESQLDPADRQLLDRLRNSLGDARRNTGPTSGTSDDPR